MRRLWTRRSLHHLSQALAACPRNSFAYSVKNASIVLTGFPSTFSTTPSAQVILCNRSASVQLVNFRRVHPPRASSPPRPLHPARRYNSSSPLSHRKTRLAPLRYGARYAIVFCMNPFGRKITNSIPLAFALRTFPCTLSRASRIEMAVHFPRTYC